MNNRLFVGNVSFKMNENDLEDLFSQFGRVVSVAMPTDRDSGRKRGFAFVEMETEPEAENAIKTMNGQNVEGRDIVVNLSKPREKNFSAPGRSA